MNRFVKIYASVRSNAKLRRLAAVLPKPDKSNKQEAATLGYMVRLWVYAAEYCKNGVFEDATFEDICDAARFTGSKKNKKAFVKALVFERFLHETVTGFSVHSWQKHMGKLDAAKEQTRLRVQKHREKQQVEQVKKEQCNALRNADVTLQSKSKRKRKDIPPAKPPGSQASGTQAKEVLDALVAEGVRRGSPVLLAGKAAMLGVMAIKALLEPKDPTQAPEPLERLLGVARICYDDKFCQDVGCLPAVIFAGGTYSTLAGRYARQQRQAASVAVAASEEFLEIRAVLLDHGVSASGENLASWAGLGVELEVLDAAVGRCVGKGGKLLEHVRMEVTHGMQA